MDDNKIIRSYINERVADGEDRGAIINELKNSGDPRIKYFLTEHGYSDSNKPEDKPLEDVATLAEAAGGLYVGKKLITEGPQTVKEIEQDFTKIGKSIRDRFLRPQADIATSFGNQTVAPTAPKVPEIVQGIDVTKLDPQMQEIVRRSEQNRIAKQQEATRIIDQQIKGFIGQHTPAPSAPITSAPSPAAPLGTPEVPTVAQMGQQALGQAPVAPPQTVEQVAAETVAPTEGKKKGRPAGSKTMTEEEKIIKKGGLPGMTKEQAGMRGHLLGMYGGKENPAAQQAYEQVKDILGYTPAYEPGKGGSLKPEETGKIKGWQKENMPGPKITLTHEMKKVLKAGGPAAVAAMVLTPEFANASTAEKHQILGEAFLPLGISPSELQSGTLDEKRLRAFQESKKLGSPYRSVPPPQ